MPKTIEFNRRSRFLVKGAVFIIVGAALFSVFGYTYNYFDKNDDSQPDELQKRSVGDPDDYFDEDEDDDIDFSDPESWQFVAGYRQSCYRRRQNGVVGEELYFKPTVFVVGLPYSGDEKVIKLLSMHPNTVLRQPYAPCSYYFDQFDYMKQVRRPQMRAYLELFADASAIIEADGVDSEKRILDCGNLLSRYYELPNEHRSPRRIVLDKLHSFTYEGKYLLVVRDPIRRLELEYCAKGYQDSFDVVINRVLDNFHAECMVAGLNFRECCYDKDIVTAELNLCNSMVLPYWEDAVAAFYAGDVKVVFMSDLLDPNKFPDIVIDIFNFLNLGVPPDDVLALMEDFLHSSSGGGSCQESLSLSTRQRLEELIMPSYNSFLVGSEEFVIGREHV